MDTCFHLRVILVMLLLSGLTPSCAKQEQGTSWPTALPVDSPADATYLIENDAIRLENGRAELPVAPGSATKLKVSLFGETVYGDLNNDGNKDALVFLTYDGGGSGTFFFLAAALSDKGQYQGTNALWLGDRIGPPNARVKNGLVTVAYLTRNQNEPMTAAPSILQTRFFMLDRSILNDVTPAADEKIYQGWLTISHAAHTFLPCDERNELWLLGKSPALDTIIDAYGKTMADFPSSTQLFATLAGKRSTSPEDDFDKEYKEAFSASRLLKVWPAGNCRSDFILLDSPLPGTDISSPLTVRGRARGTWFFEGDFPVFLLDAQGKIIEAGYATAKGEWMTENFVDFQGIIKFNTLSGQKGTLVLKKDNPTGISEFDDALEIPIHFK